MPPPMTLPRPPSITTAKLSLTLLLVMFVAALSSHAQNSSPAELRRQVQTLNDKIRLLEERLGESQTRVQRLEEDRITLRQALRQAEDVISNLRALIGSPDQVASMPQIAKTPLDPYASPASMLAELRWQYHQSLSDLPMQSPKQIAKSHEQIKIWCKNTNKQMRSKIRWLTRVDQLERTRQGQYTARVRVLDELTLLPIGDPMSLIIPKRFAQKIARERDRKPLWWINALFIATPQYDPERATPGVFEVPPFVGPFVSFAYELEWIGIKGVTVKNTTEANDSDASNAPPPTSKPR